MTLINLREWETRHPEPGNVLYERFLVAHPTGRRLAEELTKSGRIEVLELTRGLELRATSFVGRFVLGELTVSVHPNLAIRKTARPVPVILCTIFMKTMSNWLSVQRL